MNKHNKKIVFWKHAFFDSKLRLFFQNPSIILSPYIQKDDNVIDYGCGTGFFSFYMKKIVGEYGKVYGIDVEDKVFEVLNKKAVKKNLEIISSRPEILDSTELVNSIDFVLSSWSFHAIDDKLKFLERLSYVLKQDGKFLLIEPKMHMTKNEFEKEVEIILSNKFKRVCEPKIGLSYAALFIKEC